MKLPLENWTIDDITKESHYIEFLEEFFESLGWTALSEQSPAGSRDRADLLVEHEEFGWFGIEAKMTNYGGRKPAEAHHQIVKKYRGRMYLGHRINRWMYAPLYKYPGHEEVVQVSDTQRHMWLRESICVFFNRHGIGYLCPDRWQILFEDVDINHRIDLRDDSKTGSIAAITSKVERCMEEYDYS